MDVGFLIKLKVGRLELFLKIHHGIQLLQSLVMAIPDALNLRWISLPLAIVFPSEEHVRSWKNYPPAVNRPDFSELLASLFLRIDCLK